MAIIEVKEIWQGRGGDGDLKAGRRHARIFRVKTNSNLDSEVEATESGTPKLGDFHPSDNLAFCQNVRADQEVFSPRVWIITCSYSTELELTTNPLSDPTVFTWDTEQFQRVVAIDLNGNAVVNSAGYFYDPPIEADDSRLSVTMTRNEANVPAWFLNIQDVLNSDPVTIDGLSVPAERAKIQKVSAGKQQFRNKTGSRVVTATIHIQRRTWQAELQDVGFMEIKPDPDSTERRHIMDDDGNPVSSPVPLDGSGKKLVNPTFSNVIINTHPIYSLFDFSELPF